MRSSTLFALLAAVLLGLGVAVTAKATGLLSPAAPPPAPPPIMVLAAATNLFEGACLQASDVRVRPASAEEVEALKRGDLLPPMPQAAVRRFVKIGIEADRAIRRDHLEDMNAPPTLKERLAQGMEAVNLAVSKPHCAGGMISPGDWVNVLLTTSISDAAGNSTTATALLVRNVRVIAKRNSLWPVQTPLGADCPVNFTLELNPYRAALLNFVKEKGTLTLSPLSDADKRILEARRQDLMSQPGVQQASYSQPDSVEYRDEDTRVAGYLQGNYAVGDGDLMRIFQVKVEEPKEEPAPPPPVRIQRWVGVKPAGQLAFRDGNPVAEDETPPRTTTPATAGRTPAMLASRTTNNAPANRAGFTFQPPAVPCPSGGGCKKCGQK